MLLQRLRPTRRERRIWYRRNNALAKLTGLEVNCESDITSSTVTYPLPLLKSGQISIEHLNQSVDIARASIANAISKSGQINASKSGQNEVVRTGGQNQGNETRSIIVEAMRKKPKISRRELAEMVGISQSAIQKHIEHLKGAGIIIRLGSDRKGLWRVLK